MILTTNRLVPLVAMMATIKKAVQPVQFYLDDEAEML